MPYSAEPIDGTVVANCYAFNRALDHSRTVDGRVQSISIIRPDQDDLSKENTVIVLQLKASSHLSPVVSEMALREMILREMVLRVVVRISQHSMMHSS